MGRSHGILLSAIKSSRFFGEMASDIAELATPRLHLQRDVFAARWRRLATGASEGEHAGNSGNHCRAVSSPMANDADRRQRATVADWMEQADGLTTDVDIRASSYEDVLLVATWASSNSTVWQANPLTCDPDDHLLCLGPNVALLARGIPDGVTNLQQHQVSNPGRSGAVGDHHRQPHRPRPPRWRTVGDRHV